MSTAAATATATVSYAAELVQRLAAWPFVRIERRGARAVLLSGGRDLAIGAVDLREGMLSVAVPPPLVAEMLDRHPQLEPTPRGVRIALTDTERLAIGEAVLRWRVGRVRFAAQRREASP
jgi:hypothetical protein